MKRSVLISLSVLLVSVLCFSSCMKVTVTLSEGSIGSAPGKVPENTTAPAPVVTLPSVETTVPEGTTAAEGTTSATEQTTAPSATKTPLQMSKAELLEWFNKSVNDVKAVNPGFTRAKLTTVSDIVLSNQLANTLVDFVKGMLLSEETEYATATKGQSCVEIMTPTGERYVSQLSLADIKDITVTQQGTSYVVTVTMPDAKNPAKDTSTYAKIFNFITVDDVVSTYAPKVGATVDRNNITVNYSGSYAKAVISPDGKIEAYDTYVRCVMSLLDATVKKVVTINTDVDITLVSTTNFTDFSY
ncbi:MAG: hypothetical protein IKL10_05785 [Clostridia bacterium]|nr:hypothetical protein [Clostridia bacterium]